MRILDSHDYAKPDRSLSWGGELNIHRIGCSVLAQAVFTRDLYDRAGGYGQESYGEDSELSARMLRLPEVRAASPASRTATSRSSTAGAMGSTTSVPTAGHEGRGRVPGCGAERARGHPRAGKIGTGVIRLVPRLNYDYASIARAFVRR